MLKSITIILAFLFKYGLSSDNPLTLSDSVLSIDLLEVSDRDAWETQVPLSVRVRMTGGDGRDTFSLSTVQGLDFEDENQLGSGSLVRSASFSASPEKASRALSQVRVNFAPDSSPSTLHFDVSVTDNINPAEIQASSSISLTLTSIPTIVSLSSRVFNFGMDSSVLVFGRNLEADIAACRFGNEIGTALRINSSQIICSIPPILAIGAHLLSLNTRAGLASNALQLNIVGPLHITSLSPSAASLRGGATLLISLQDTNLFELDCVFNDHSYKAVLIGARLIQCTVPAGAEAGIVPVSLAYTSQPVNSNAVSFSYFPIPVVLSAEDTMIVPSSLIPQFFSLFGDFLETTVACLIGPYKTSVVVISSLSLQCAVPRLSHINGIQPISLVLTSEEIIGTGFSVTFNKPPYLLSAYPPLLPYLGPAANISVVGQNFDMSSAYTCSFGNLSSSAHVVNSSLLLCSAPTFAVATASQYVPLAVTSSVGIIVPSNIMIYFYMAPEVESIFPLLAPSTGGFEAIISGSGFLDFGLTECVWSCELSFYRTPFSRKDASHSTCSTPTTANATASSCIVGISWNSLDYTLLAEDFLLFARPILISVDISRGPSSGGTVVEISGSFSNTTNLLCAFGTMYTSAVFVNFSAVSCTSPSDNAPTSGTVNLTVVYWPYADYTADKTLLFTYYKEVLLTSITPIGGTLVSPTNLILQGSGFLNYSSLVCASGSELYPASYVSSSEMYCIFFSSFSSNSSLYGNMDIAVSLNGQQFSNPISFFRWKPITISGISPRTVVVGTDVTFTVYFEDRLTSNEVVCVINGAVIIPYRIAVAYIVCDAQTIPQSDRITVGVSQDRGQTVDSTSQAGVVNSISVVGIDGTSFLEGGAGAVMLNLSEPFASSFDATCVFNLRTTSSPLSLVRKVSVEDSASLLCPVQGLPLGKYDLGIVLNDVLIYSTPTSVNILSKFGLVSVSPSTRLSLRKDQNLRLSWNVGPTLTTDLKLTAHFQSTTFPCQMLNKSTMECNLVSNSIGMDLLSVSLGLKDLSPVMYLSTFVSTAGIQVVPDVVPTFQDSVVSIYGTSFRESSIFEFNVGDSNVRVATYVSPRELSCLVPSSSVAINSTLFLAVDGVELFSSPLNYHILPIFQNTNEASIFFAGEVITTALVNVTAFAPYCAFNGSFSPSLPSSESYVRCRAPSLAGTYYLDASLDGINVAGHPKLVQIVVVPVVTQISPAIGLARGGAELTLQGSGFFEGILCVFGDLTVATTTLSSSSSISCKAPSGVVGESVSLSLTVSRHINIPTGFSFEFIAEPVLVLISPSSGPETGNTRIVLSILAMPTWSSFSCIINGKITPAEPSFRSTISCLTPSSPPGTATINVLLNNNEILLSSMEFIYYPLPSFSLTTPYSCSMSGGCFSYIVGANFIDSSELVVLLGNRTIKAVYYNSTNIGFHVPSSNSAGLVKLEVSNNGVDFSSFNASFLYIEPIKLNMIPEPLVGPATGNSLVSFSVIPSTSSDIECIFGNVSAIARTDNGITFDCITEGGISGFLPLELRCEGASIGLFSYFFYSPPVLKQLFPASSGEFGGSTIVRGYGFFLSNRVSCRFGNSLSEGAFLSPETIRCRIPSTNQLGTVPLQLSFNGVDFVESALYFTYTSYATIYQISPSTVVDMGENITVTGTSFLNSTLCLFGNVGVQAVEVLSSTLLICTVPSKLPAVTLVRVSNNGFDRSSSSVVLNIVKPLVVTARSLLLGPTSGQTAIVLGLNTNSSSQSYCRFGDDVVNATVLSSGASSITCSSPTQLGDGKVALFLSVNAVRFYSTGLAFEYYFPAQIRSISPSFGSERGGTRIFIKGSNFGPRLHTFCVFGSKDLISAVRFETDSAISCMSPPHLPQSVELTLTSNLQQSSSSFALFSYTRELVLTSLLPQRVHDGFVGTVSVFGSGFLNTSQLICLIDGFQSAAEYLDDSSIQCVTRFSCPLSIFYSVQILNNGVDLSSSTLFVECIPAFEVLQLPSIIAWNVRDAMLIIEGTGFDASFVYMCTFSGQPPNPSTFLSFSLIQCPLPYFKSMSAASLSIGLTISTENLVSVALPIIVIRVPQIMSITPESGPDSPGWILTLCFLDSLSMDTPYVVTLGSSFLCKPAIFATSLQCIVPSLPTGDVNIGLQLENQTFVSSLGMVHIIGQSRILSISPDYSYECGNQTITVTGTGFPAFPPLCCVFDGIVVAADRISSETVSCQAPSHSQGIVQMSTGLCEALSSSDPPSDLSLTSSVSFFYLSREVIDGYFPSFGLISNSSILLRGAGFDVTKVYSCLFSSAPMFDAIVVSSHVLQCALPSISSNSSTIFALSIVDKALGDDPIYEASILVHYPTVWSITPSSQMELGGAEVDVFGFNLLFAEFDPYCRFGSVVVRGRVAVLRDASWHIFCTSPPSMPSEVPLYVSSNGVQYIDTGLFFSYTPLPQISAYTPTVATRFTSSISFHGSYFEHIIPGLSCVFGSLNTTASANSNTSVLQCPLPASWKSLEFGFTFTLGLAVGLSPSFFNASMVFVASRQVIHVSPSLGPASGGTLLLIRGFHAIQIMNSTYCFFGGINTSAVLIDASTMGCFSPSFQASNSDSVPFQVSVDGGYSFFPTQLEFFMYYSLSISLRVYPTVLLEGEPAALVISGSKFPLLTSSSFCRIGHSTFQLVIISKMVNFVSHFFLRSYCMYSNIPQICRY